MLPIPGLRDHVLCSPSAQHALLAERPARSARRAPSTLCSPSAQHAVRQARVLADNVAAVVRGRQPADYKHKQVGSVAGLGLHKGVAYVYGVKVKGLPAWIMHRSYHMSRIPTLNRKIRVICDWTLALFLKREVIALGSLHEPREPFVEVTPPIRPREEVPA